jgi:hypothetical protein
LFLILRCDLVEAIISHHLDTVHGIVEDALSRVCGFALESVGFLGSNTSSERVILINLPWSKDCLSLIAQAIECLLSTEAFGAIGIVSLIVLFNSGN